MDGSTGYRSCASRFNLLYFPFLSFTSAREVADMAVWWTAAPDIGPAHHASTCSTFLSFRLRAFAKWLIWPCGGRQHRLSVLRITLLHALLSFPFLSFPFIYEHSRSGRYGRVVDGSTGYRSCASRFNLLCFPLLCFAFLYECSRSG